MFLCLGVPLDSMLFSSMTTSMQLAEECLRQEPTEGELRATDAAQPFEGLELFAQTIDAGTVYIYAIVHSVFGLDINDKLTLIVCQFVRVN